MDARYCDVIIKRLTAMAEAEAIHAASGKPFPEIARERSADTAVDRQPDPTNAGDAETM